MIELNKLVGQVLTEEIKNALKAQYSSIRIGPEGGIYTMDYRVGRVNVRYDQNNVIVKVFYG